MRKSARLAQITLLAAALGGVVVEEKKPVTPPKKRLIPIQGMEPSMQFYREQKIRQGLTEFFYPGHGSLFALNEKNATRKAKRLGWI